MTTGQRLDQTDAAIVIPRMVFWGLILPLIVAICGGSWYMAVLSMTVAGQGTRLTVVEAKTDTNKDATAITTNTINDRLTRMEAQLGFLVKASDAAKK